MIFNCNSAIEGLNASTLITTSVKEQLLGEAKFIRAFYYFYLVNMYGDVPLIINTDYKNNSLLGRSSTGTVYKQIIEDLISAKNLLTGRVSEWKIRTLFR